MARKIRAKLIMELREQGLSRRRIAGTRRMSMESVCEVFGIAAERDIGWEDVRDLADDEVYRLFYPERHVRESVFEEPDWEYVHKEMAKVVLALPQNQPNAPLYPAGGAPGSRPGALPHFGRPRYLGPPPRARSTAG